MHWMIRWAGGFPVFADEARGARFRDVDGHEYVDFCLGDTGAMTGHSPEPTVRAIAEQARRGITLMLPSEDSLWVGERAGAPLRPAALAVRAHGHRREPLRDPARPRAHRPPEDPGLQLVLPRHRRRDVRRRSTATRSVVAREGNVGPPVAARGDDAGRRVERRRGARARARARRRRLRPRRAGADEHRDRPARARVPRRAARGDPRGRDAADHRRDAHDLRRPRRLHGRVRARAGPAHDRQADRRRPTRAARTASRPRSPSGSRR